MRVTLFGKVHKKGISKSGNPYDFIELHLAMPKRGVTGDGAERKIVDASLFDFEKLALGVYNADFDGDGNLLSLAPLQKNS